MVRLRRLLVVLLTAAAVILAARTLAEQWRQFQSSGATVHVAWTPLLVSGLLVLISYVVLIETW
jgi:hypothetical protein